MHARTKWTALSAGLAALALAGCGSDSSTAPRFDGTTGTAWEVRATGGSDVPGFSDYSPPGSAFFFMLDRNAFMKYDGASDAWTSKATPPANMGVWPSQAWVGDSLYVVRNGAVYRYAIGTDAWTTPVASGVVDTSDSMTTHDDSGFVYAMAADGSQVIVQYEIATGTVKTFPGPATPLANEPRLGWDAVTRKLYVAPSYSEPDLYSFDPATGTVTKLTDVPGVGGPGTGTGMGDPFCSDRSGHLYAIGDTGCSDSSSVFQYDTRTDTWKAVPDLPFNHGCNGACTVTDDGWLYLTDGDTTSLARLKLN